MATMIVAAMAASMFVLARVFGPAKANPAHTDSGEITQNPGINDADSNTYANVAKLTQTAENGAKKDTGKTSEVENNVITAASVQTATVTQYDTTNIDDDINVIDQDQVEILVRLGLLG